ncbi:hypothetical protein ABZY44_32795 [Streptomyces sp. NPDC006544]|uniref:hypothetical protein n=1 Tax=Streptomyces sp. NPDC006544 TaxID=3154583 RepID=UPI0033AD67BA
MTRDGEPEGPVEVRLRQALDARAAGITVRALRPARPPGQEVRRMPWVPARLRVFALPLAGLAAAAAAVVGYAVLGPDSAPLRPDPVPPAAPPSPSPTVPSPPPSAAGPSVSPSPSGSAASPPVPTPAPGTARPTDGGTGAPKPSATASRPSSPSAAPSIAPSTAGASASAPSASPSRP